MNMPAMPMGAKSDTTSLRTFALFRGLIFALLLLTLTGCQRSKVVDDEPAAVRPVKLITVEAASAIESRTYPAVIEAATFRALSFQVSGLIEKLPVKEGSEIKQGDVIAQLDLRDFQSRLNSVQSQYNNAKEDYERALRLDASNAIAKSTVDQRLSQYEVAEAQLEMATKALEDTVLRAPIDGVITKLNVDELQNVQAGTAIVSMIGSDGMQALVNVPANLISRVNQRKDRSAFVTLDSLPGVQLPAKFNEATLEADASSQTFQIAFLFTPTEDVLVLPGMTASVTLSSSSLSDMSHSTAVPLAAILVEGDTNFIWLVDESTMTVSKQPVEVSESIGEKLEVTAGLKPGDVIVGAGAHYLSEEMQVRAWTAQ